MNSSAAQLIDGSGVGARVGAGVSQLRRLLKCPERHSRTLLRVRPKAASHLITMGVAQSRSPVLPQLLEIGHGELAVKVRQSRFATPKIFAPQAQKVPHPTQFGKQWIPARFGGR